ncbi:MAG TPA: hypothetical protein PLU72_02850 [Candidatus Ozemobacteraceae bacterium]|nr:hypothetical protein [Candidatus Ozemobacteraceae bacterium]
MPEPMTGPTWNTQRPAALAARRGFLLPAIVLIALVLALMFGALSYMTRGQVHSAAYFIDASRALGLAEAGAGWAIAALASGSYTESPPFVRRAFYDAMFSDGGTDYEGDVEPCDELKQYINKLGGDLSLRVRLSRWQPLVAGAPGFKNDPVEKMGRIDVEAVAEVGNARRKVRMSRGVKVYLAVHPVIGKFTCFIRKKPASDDLVNALERTTNGAGFTNGTPLVLNNRGAGNGFNVVTPALDLGALPDLNELSKSSGWVFLNSDTAPWTLNLAGSANDTDYDDRSMLRFGAYSNDALLTAVNTPPQAGGTTVTQVNEKFQGLKRDYTISKGGSVVVASDFLSVRHLFPSLPKASIIRPFGTNGDLSPTLLFGPVLRRYLRVRSVDCKINISGVDKTFKEVGVPGFPDESSFKQAFLHPPTSPRDYADDFVLYAQLWNMIADAPGLAAGWNKWRSSQTTLVSEPFIEGLNYLAVAERETGTVQNPVSKAYTDPPPDVVTGLDLWAGGSEGLRKAEGIFGASGKPLFEGGLGEIEGIREFGPKITAMYAAPKAYLDRHLDQSGNIAVAGVVYLGPEDLLIDRKWNVTAGGVLVVGGNIDIRAGIRSAEPLTLVSTENITIDTSEPVEAQLICLRGKFTPRNAFTIRGGVAAGEIDLTNMVNSQKKQINWDSRFDPYAVSSAMSVGSPYRYRVSEEEEYVVEPGK